MGLPRPKPYIALAVCAALCLVVRGAACAPPEVDTETFRDGAFIEYSTSFELPLAPEHWCRLQDTPLLIVALWNACGFEPAYRLYHTATGMHVIDPDGLEGDMWCLERTPGRRVLLADGRMRKWGPFSLRGRALFQVESEAVDARRVRVRLTIYGEGSDSFVGNLTLKALSPLLSLFIDRRVDRHVDNIKVMAADIRDNPDAVSRRLPLHMRGVFARVFGTGMADTTAAPSSHRNP